MQSRNRHLYACSSLNLFCVSYLLDKPEGSVSDEEGEGQEDDAGDDHNPGKHPEGQLASHKDPIKIPDVEAAIFRVNMETVYPMFGVRA